MNQSKPLIEYEMVHNFFLCNLISKRSCSSAGKEFACNAGDPGSIPGLGRSLGEGNHNPL